LRIENSGFRIQESDQKSEVRSRDSEARSGASGLLRDVHIPPPDF